MQLENWFFEFSNSGVVEKPVKEWYRQTNQRSYWTNSTRAPYNRTM